MFSNSCSTLKSVHSFCLRDRPANTNRVWVSASVQACLPVRVSGDNNFQIQSIRPCRCMGKKALAQQYCAPSTQSSCCASNGAKIEMEINDSALSRRMHWCPLMANNRQIQMAPFQCMTEGWFHRAAQHFPRSGASRWWMKRMMELS